MPDIIKNLYFSPDLSDREIACFEAGIKLGALYHILCGIPISTNENTINSIEKGIEEAILCQPHVKSVKIFLDRDKIIGDKTTQFDYDEITGKIIRARVVINYATIEIVARIDWVEDLQYPLMFIEKINESH
ncbi:MAG: dihydroneopterin aldolase family protein [Promethearchaeota archaeon]